MTEETNVVTDATAQGEAAPESSNDTVSDETQETAPPENEQDDTDKQERKEPDSQKQSKLDRRIGELTYRARQAERDKAALEQRIAELEKRSAPPPPERPRKENFETEEEYEDALFDWRDQKRLSEQKKTSETENQKQAKQQETETRVQSFRAKADVFIVDHPDFFEVGNNFIIPPTQNGAEIGAYVSAHDKAPELIYALGKDSDLAGQIVSLPAHYAKQRIDALAAKLGAKPQPTQTLPEPPKGLKTSGPRGKSLEAMSGDELLNLIKKRK